MAEMTLQVGADAMARVEKLGMRKEFEQMLEHAQQTAPRLRGIRAVLEHDPECVHEGPQVVIWVHREEPRDPEVPDRTYEAWCDWRRETFSPEVCWEIKMFPVDGGPDGW